VASTVLAVIASAATVSATATPSSVSFTYEAGASTLRAAQVVAVRSSSGTTAFTAAINPEHGSLAHGHSGERKSAG